MKKPAYKVAPNHGVRLPRYQSVGHSPGDLMWWIGQDGLIQWQVFDGLHHHHDVSPLDMDARWRGRLDDDGNATLLPPVKLYSRKPDDLMSHLPIGAMITLAILGAKQFYIDSTMGLLRLKKCRDVRQRKMGKK